MRRLTGNTFHRVSHAIIEIFIIAFFIGFLGFIAYLATN